MPLGKVEIDRRQSILFSLSQKLNLNMSRSIIVTMMFCILLLNSYAQNIGIGTSNPAEKFTVNGNFFITGQTIKSTKAPDAGHTFTLFNAGDTARYVTDSTYKVLDPAGAANYTANMYGAISMIDTGFFAGSTAGGMELAFELINLGTGDTITITDLFTNMVMAKYSNSNNGQTPTISGLAMRISFAANADASVGQGFSAIIRKLYPASGTTGSTAATAYAGAGLFFNGSNGSFKVGAGVSTGSLPGAIAMGVGSTAQGRASMALGLASHALGENDFALGSGTASGSRSIAIGGVATGKGAIAIGRGANASGIDAISLTPYAQSRGSLTTAIGVGSIADGNSSLAMLGGSTTPESTKSLAIGESATAGAANSIAIGKTTVTTGNSAVAMGDYARAGTGSVAIGKNIDALNGTNNLVMGDGSSIYNGSSNTVIGNSNVGNGIATVVIGQQNTASGTNAIVIGKQSYASGTGSIALGSNVSADANYSIAIGTYATAYGQEGSLTIADHSNDALVQALAPNAMRARFAGGVRFYTNREQTVGAILHPGASSWSAYSDVRKKENFLSVNPETVLQKISKMPQFTWNYIGQDVKKERHYGPMAQDFYKAFGKDELGEIGCDTLINQQDFLGINLIAIQALEKRTTELIKENEQLKNDYKALAEKVEKMSRGRRRRK